MMLRVATLNLRADADRWPERLPLVIDALCAADADVIGLQEVRLKIEQAHRIAAALNARIGCQYQVFVAEDWFTPHILGNALLSRLPVLDYERIELPEGYRTAQRVRLQIGAVSVDIANTHLHHKPARDEAIRLPQMQRILTWLQQSTAMAAILMGDMNARPTCATIQAVHPYLQSAYATMQGCEPPMTFPTPLRTDLTPQSARTIDYIFYTPSHLRVTHADLIAHRAAPHDATLYASDHFGLQATFTPVAT